MTTDYMELKKNKSSRSHSLLLLLLVLSSSLLKPCRTVNSHSSQVIKGQLNCLLWQISRLRGEETFSAKQIMRLVSMTDYSETERRLLLQYA